MCEPVTISALTAVASTGLGIASSVMGYQQQKQQAQMQNLQSMVNERRAMDAYNNETRALNSRQIQEQEAAAQQKLALDREADAVRASAVNTAGANGVSGLSVDGLLSDLEYQKQDRMSTVDTNLQNTLNQLQDQKTAQGVNYMNRVASVPRAAKPSSAGMMLGIAGSLVDGVSQGFKSYNTYVKPYR